MGVILLLDPQPNEWKHVHNQKNTFLLLQSHTGHFLHFTLAFRQVYTDHSFLFTRHPMFYVVSIWSITDNFIYSALVWTAIYNPTLWYIIHTVHTSSGNRCYMQWSICMWHGLMECERSNLQVTTFCMGTGLLLPLFSFCGGSRNESLLLWAKPKGEIFLIRVRISVTKTTPQKKTKKKKSQSLNNVASVQKHGEVVRCWPLGSPQSMPVCLLWHRSPLTHQRSSGEEHHGHTHALNVIVILINWWQPLCSF